MIDVFEMFAMGMCGQIFAEPYLLGPLSRYGDQVELVIEHDATECIKMKMIFGRSFADIGVGEPLD